MKRIILSSTGLLILFTLLGLFLRSYQVANLPLVNRDELSIGYNAYTLSQTGLDEHQAGPWPINFKAFGEYKLPGLIYTIMPVVKWLGLSITSIRLPNIIFGTLLIPLTYLLLSTYFKKRSWSLAAAFLTATAFFHLHGSRSAYEPVAALTLTAVFLILLAQRLKPLTVVAIWVSSFLAMMFYNSHLFLLPLFALGWLLINSWQEKKLNPGRVVVVTGVIIVALASWQLLSEVNASRINTTVIDNQALKHQAIDQALALEVKGWPRQLVVLTMKGWHLMGYQMAKNYLVSAGPAYVFFVGDDNPWHNFRFIGFGNLNIVLLPLAVYGAIEVVRKKRREGNYQLLLLWLLLSVLPSAVTADAPVTNRLFEYHFLLIILAAFGWVAIGKRWVRWGLVVMYLTVTGIFLFRYFNYATLDPHPLWGNGLEKVILAVDPVKDQYSRIYLEPDAVAGGNAYVYPAFFLKMAPAEFYDQVVYRDNRLNAVEQLGKYVFDNPDEDGDNGLYIKRIENNRTDDEAEVIIYDRVGNPIWEVIKL
jgi:4-amino-4-deoxy-L-arabinose transferase-like glycosyltransferase